MRTIERSKPAVQLQKKLHFMAKSLRKGSTPTEQLLWKYLKGRNQFAVRFRRQYPIHNYIVDFCCYQRKLIIELDGPIHETQQERDQTKDLVLSKYGFVILRFKNADVTDNLQSVLKRIHSSLFSSLGEES